MRLWKAKQRSVMDKPTPDEPLAEWELQLLASDSEPVFVETYRSARGDTVIEDRDGVSWYDAPTPPPATSARPRPRAGSACPAPTAAHAAPSAATAGNWYERNSR
jgi:hypothetical protein